MSAVDQQSGAPSNKGANCRNHTCASVDDTHMARTFFNVMAFLVVAVICPAFACGLFSQHGLDGCPLIGPPSSLTDSMSVQLKVRAQVRSVLILGMSSGCHQGSLPLSNSAFVCRDAIDGVTARPHCQAPPRDSERLFPKRCYLLCRIALTMRAKLLATARVTSGPGAWTH